MFKWTVVGLDLTVPTDEFFERENRIEEMVASCRPAVTGSP
jgi:hypothetical protein